MAWQRSERPTRTPPGLSAVSSTLLLRQRHCWFGWTRIFPDLGGWTVGSFLFTLLFPSSDQCCDSLTCPCSFGRLSCSRPGPWYSSEDELTVLPSDEQESTGISMPCVYVPAVSMSYAVCVCLCVCECVLARVSVYACPRERERERERRGER